METDDFSGTCGEGKYPLLTAIAATIRFNPSHLQHGGPFLPSGGTTIVSQQITELVQPPAAEVAAAATSGARASDQSGPTDESSPFYEETEEQPHPNDITVLQPTDELLQQPSNIIGQLPLDDVLKKPADVNFQQPNDIAKQQIELTQNDFRRQPYDVALQHNNNVVISRSNNANVQMQPKPMLTNVPAMTHMQVNDGLDRKLVGKELSANEMQTTSDDSTNIVQEDVLSTSGLEMNSFDISSKRPIKPPVNVQLVKNSKPTNKQLINSNIIASQRQKLPSNHKINVISVPPVNFHQRSSLIIQPTSIHPKFMFSPDERSLNGNIQQLQSTKPQRLQTVVSKNSHIPRVIKKPNDATLNIRNQNKMALSPSENNMLNVNSPLPTFHHSVFPNENLINKPTQQAAPLQTPRQKLIKTSAKRPPLIIIEGPESDLARTHVQVDRQFEAINTPLQMVDTTFTQPKKSKLFEHGQSQDQSQNLGQGQDQSLGQGQFKTMLTIYLIFALAKIALYLYKAFAFSRHMLKQSCIYDSTKYIILL